MEGNGRLFHVLLSLNIFLVHGLEKGKAVERHYYNKQRSIWKRHQMNVGLVVVVVARICG